MNQHLESLLHRVRDFDEQLARDLDSAIEDALWEARNEQWQADHDYAW